MVSEKTVQQTYDALQKGEAMLLDVRTHEEWSKGVAQGAQCLGRDHLESRLLSMQLDKDTPLYVICASGGRSLFAAQGMIERLGFNAVYSVQGGTRTWVDHELPMQTNQAVSYRYDRQCKLPEVGQHGQQQLANSHALILGMGGLGCPVAMYLAGAGVGTLTIVDMDQVDESNLHRQVLYANDQVGRNKVDAAYEKLVALNPEIRIHRVAAKVDDVLLDALLSDVDVVLECTDSTDNRYLVDRYCKRYQKPMVYGACDQWSGQVALFQQTEEINSCYRCLYPVRTEKGAVQNCQEAGVMGVVPGTTVLLQATLALECLLGMPVDGAYLHVYDAKRLTMDRVSLPRCAC